MSSEQILMVHSLTNAVNRRAINFFDAVAAEVLGRGRDLKDKLQVIVVVHAYENTLPFIQALDKTVDIVGIVMKNATDSLRPEYAMALKAAGFNILNLKKTDFTIDEKAKNKTVDKIEKLLDPKKKLIIMDHGGYFAFLGRDLLDHESFPTSQLIGITEFGANGEVRWKNMPVDRPIISIARSAIKYASDTASAESVVDGAVSFCMGHNVPLLAKTIGIGVIGYGRLGSGIVEKLARNRASNILVHDIDELKVSGLRQVRVVNKAKLLAKSDVIFCATGNRALNKNDFNQLKSGTILFTVTSSDDELDIANLIEKKVIELVSKNGQAHVYRVVKTGNLVFLPFNGESANAHFSSAVSDPTILQPYALQFMATLRLFQDCKGYARAVQPVEPRYETAVARIWHQIYNPDYRS